MGFDYRDYPSDACEAHKCQQRGSAVFWLGGEIAYWLCADHYRHYQAQQDARIRIIGLPEKV